MILKNYKDVVFEMNVGIITEGINSGKYTYVELPEIKEVFLDGQWVKNEGFDLAKIKSQKLFNIESEILESSMRLEKANSLNLQTQVSELTAKLTELNKQKGDINAL